MPEHHRILNADGTLAAEITGYTSLEEHLAHDPRSLVIARPLVANVPDGKPEWTKAPCPRCGEPCWIRDIEPNPLPPRVSAACTACALKASR